MARKLSDLITKLDTRSWWNSQGIPNLATFLIGALILGLSILMGLKFVIELFWSEEASGWSWPSMIVIALTTMVGIIVSELNIQKYNNQTLPVVITVYTWLCAVFTLLVYLRVIVRLYEYQYPYPDRFQLYVIAVSMTSLAVFLLPILHDRYDVRLFSIPILVGNLFHLLMITYHYVFSNEFVNQQNDKILTDRLLTDKITINHYFGADIFFFFLMLLIAITLLSNPRFMVTLKSWLDKTFQFAE